MVLIFGMQVNIFMVSWLGQFFKNSGRSKELNKYVKVIVDS